MSSFSWLLIDGKANLLICSTMYYYCRHFVCLGVVFILSLLPFGFVFVIFSKQKYFWWLSISTGYTLLGLCGIRVVAETDWDSVKRRRLDGANSLLSRFIQKHWLFVLLSFVWFVP